MARVCARGLASSVKTRGRDITLIFSSFVASRHWIAGADARKQDDARDERTSLRNARLVPHHRQKIKSEQLRSTTPMSDWNVQFSKERNDTSIRIWYTSSMGVQAYNGDGDVI